MKKSGIIVLIVIVGVIVAYAGLQMNSANLAPSISDTPIIDEDVEILQKYPSTSEEKVPEINNEGFYIDEEGIKHYVISASDTPTLGD